MTVKEYAEKQQISIETVRRHIRSGKLSASLSDGKYILDVNNVSKTPPKHHHNTTTTPPQQDNHTTTTPQQHVVAGLKSEISYLKEIISNKDKSLSLQDTVIGAKDKEIEILKGKLADVQSQLDYANRSIWAKIWDVFLFRN